MMLNIGIIGCGKIAEVRHAPEYTENPNTTLTAYYDVSPERADLLAGEHGGTVYGSIDELLASDVDAVSVCVANNKHAEVSIRALQAGKHVLCEKPMAITMQDCVAMVEAASAAGKQLMIGLNQGFTKAHVRAKEILDSGELGSVLAFRTSFGHPGPEGWTGRPDSWFFDRRVASFGAMADLGVHKTDLLHYLTGLRIVRTSAAIVTLDKKLPDGTPISVDDNALALYTLENGALGTMHVSWTNYGVEENSTKIFCQRGVIRLYDDPESSLIVEIRDGEVTRYQLDQLTSNKEQTTGGRTSTGVIDAFVDSIFTGEPPLASGASALHAMEVIFANERSAETGLPVAIPFTGSHPRRLVSRV